MVEQMEVWESTGDEITLTFDGDEYEAEECGFKWVPLSPRRRRKRRE